MAQTRVGIREQTLTSLNSQPVDTSIQATACQLQSEEYAIPRHVAWVSRWLGKLAQGKVRNQPSPSYTVSYHATSVDHLEDDHPIERWHIMYIRPAY
ncbi:hypothetical protein J6590_077655 [Homalodisca vitripennis]|nr:hypothetical protein J6590_077655 [Homalodisca vitripennis]